jgi:hypothetical protein
MSLVIKHSDGRFRLRIWRWIGNVVVPLSRVPLELKLILVVILFSIVSGWPDQLHRLKPGQIS